MDSTLSGSSLLDRCSHGSNPDGPDHVESLAPTTDSASPASITMHLDNSPVQQVARVLTPPTSEDMDKKDGIDHGELSDDEDDDWDIEPDHYWGEGKIPIFKPVSTCLCPILLQSADCNPNRQCDSFETLKSSLTR
jgi:hypothetical protein